MDEFFDWVKDALNHLYDYRYLEASPLAPRCPGSGGGGPSARGLRLHRLLLESIEELLPAGTATFDTTQTRLYYILSFRYVEERTVPDIMSRLGLSRRQFFREQNKATTALAGIVLQRISRQPAPGTSLPEQTLETEARRLGGQGGLLDIEAVLVEAVSFVQPLAQERSVSLEVEFDGPLPSVRANRILLRQAVLKIFSTLIACGQTKCVSVRAYGAGGGVRIELAASLPEQRRGRAPSVDESTRRLVELAGGSCGVIERTDDALALTCEFPAGDERSVLVVDDNEQIVSVFRRYLSPHGFQVLGATTADEALRLAHEGGPEVITLDVMMPGQDGWEILRQLKADPLTAAIPVVVCSVLEDPALAYSLGAAAYLTKPVSQDDLLISLRTLVEAPGS
jgi:CheY-like chemotaxis protein